MKSALKPSGGGGRISGVSPKKLSEKEKDLGGAQPKQQASSAQKERPGRVTIISGNALTDHRQQLTRTQNVDPSQLENSFEDLTVGETAKSKGKVMESNENVS